MGRLQPGVGLGEAQAALDGLAERLRGEVEVLETAGYRLSVTPLSDELTAEVRPVLMTLLGAVGVVLLIACANVANLLLVRASTREREIAVRTALGATRGRIVLQLVVESLALGVGGAVVGAVLAVGGLDVLLSLRPANLPRLDALRIDGVALAFTTGIALIAALVFGIVPALRASSPQLSSVLTDRAQSASGHRHRVFRDGLVVLETVLAVVLLIGSGLMARSFISLLQVDPGFDAENLLTFEVNLPPATYDAERLATFNRRFASDLQAIPGVTSASAAFAFPFQDQAFGGRYGPSEALPISTALPPP
jgi:predicted permease